MGVIEFLDTLLKAAELTLAVVLAYVLFRLPINAAVRMAHRFFACGERRRNTYKNFLKVIAVAGVPPQASFPVEVSEAMAADDDDEEEVIVEPIASDTADAAAVDAIVAKAEAEAQARASSPVTELVILADNEVIEEDEAIHPSYWQMS